MCVTFTFKVQYSSKGSQRFCLTFINIYIQIYQFLE